MFGVSKRVKKTKDVKTEVQREADVHAQVLKIQNAVRAAHEKRLPLRQGSIYLHGRFYKIERLDVQPFSIRSRIASRSLRRILVFLLKRRRLRKNKGRSVITGPSPEEQIEQARNKYESKVEHPLNSGDLFGGFFKQ